MQIITILVGYRFSIFFGVNDWLAHIFDSPSSGKQMRMESNPYFHMFFFTTYPDMSSSLKGMKPLDKMVTGEV